MKAFFMSCLVIVLLATLIACGGSSSPVPPPTPNNAGYSNASLNGSYVFNLSGVGSGDVFVVAGVLTADGNGNITSGQEDVNDFAFGVFQQTISNGTYSIGTDGRGQATLNFATGPSVTLQFVLVSSSKARVIELSNFELSNGVFELQDSTAIHALTGPYVLRMDGTSNNGAVISRLGLLTASGSGGAGSVVLDENYNSVFTPTIPGINVSFSFTGGPGRGLLSFSTSQGGANSSGTTFNLAFYVVNATRIEFISLNPAEQVSGYGDVQSGTFTTASVSDPYVYSISGSSVNGFITETGSFTFNSGQVTNGLEDLVNSGFFSSSVPFSGTYTADNVNNGRFTGTFTASGRTVNFVLWFSSTQNAVLMATGGSSALVESGLVTLQPPPVPSNSTLNGNYALHLAGVTSGCPGGCSAVLEGQVLANGQGTFVGVEDFNQGGSITTGTSANGSYSFAANGRGTGTIGGIPVVLYPASSNTAYVMSTDGSRMVTGSLEAQH